MHIYTKIYFYSFVPLESNNNYFYFEYLIFFRNIGKKYILRTRDVLFIIIHDYKL